jgi:hypothetical protein
MTEVAKITDEMPRTKNVEVPKGLNQLFAQDLVVWQGVGNPCAKPVHDFEQTGIA